MTKPIRGKPSPRNFWVARRAVLYWLFAQQWTRGCVSRTPKPTNTLRERSSCTGSGNNEGANVAYGIKRMGSNASDTPDYNNRAGLINAINSVVAQARTPLTESIYEAYRYFSGRTPRFGTSNVPASRSEEHTSELQSH